MLGTTYESAASADRWEADRQIARRHGAVAVIDAEDSKGAIPG